MNYVITKWWNQFRVKMVFRRRQEIVGNHKATYSAFVGFNLAAFNFFLRTANAEAMPELTLELKQFSGN